MQIMMIKKTYSTLALSLLHEIMQRTMHGWRFLCFDTTVALKQDATIPESLSKAGKPKRKIP